MAKVAGEKPRVVITRSARGNAALADRLRSLGLQPVEMDTIEFLPPADWSGVDSSLSRLGEFDWLVFTSATGAEFFARRMADLSLPAAWGDRPSVAAVGEKTADALREREVRVDFVPSEYTTLSLAKELPAEKGARLLVSRADIGDPRFVPLLRGRGYRVKDLAIYRTVSVGGASAGPFALGAAAVVFASSSAVEAFMNRLGPEGDSALKSAVAVCIGPVTARAATESGFVRVVTSKLHTLDGVVETLKTVIPGSD